MRKFLVKKKRKQLLMESDDVITLITSSLQKLDEEDIVKIRWVMSSCNTFEKSTQSEIEKWRYFRIDEELRYFSFFGTLILAKHGFFKFSFDSKNQ